MGTSARQDAQLGTNWLEAMYVPDDDSRLGDFVVALTTDFKQVVVRMSDLVLEIQSDHTLPERLNSNVRINLGLMKLES